LKNPDKVSIARTYFFAGTKGLGLTICTDLLQRTVDKPVFRGAQCIDISMQEVPFTGENPLPKEFVNITWQLEDLFVHPWALNVPQNEKEFWSTLPDVNDRRKHK
jgi:hypothetical protein